MLYSGPKCGHENMILKAHLYLYDIFCVRKSAILLFALKWSYAYASL